MSQHDALIRTAQMLNPHRSSRDIRETFKETLAEIGFHIRANAKINAELTGRSVEDCMDHKWHKETQNALSAVQTCDDLLELLPSVANRRGLAPAFDTLDDFPWADQVQSPSQLCARLCDVVMAQRDGVTGFTVAGGIDLDGWACNGQWGGRRLTFVEDENTAYLVRSLPKARAGLPLEKGEERRLVVLMRNKKCPSKSYVSYTTFQLLESIVDKNGVKALDSAWSTSPADTWGPLGVNMVGISQFDSERHVNGPEHQAKDNRGFHTILGTFRRVYCAEQPPDRPDQVVAGNYQIMNLAGSLANVMVKDWPKYFGIERLGSVEDRANRIQQNQKFDFEVGRTVGGLYVQKTRALFVYAAEQYAERLSYAGVLDMSADPFLAKALPDALIKPNQMPLLMALATRVAVNVRMFWHPPMLAPMGRPNDQYSAQQFDMMLRCSLGPVIAGAQGAGAKGFQSGLSLLNVDCTLKYAIEELRAAAKSLERGTPNAYAKELFLTDNEPREAYEAIGATMSDRIDQLLECLYHAGVALTNAVCAAPPITNYYHLKSPQLSPALACIDKTAVARSELCYEHDPSMGSLLVQNAPRRRATRDELQKKLLGTCCDVESMIRDYRFKGCPLAVESASAAERDAPVEKASPIGGSKKARAKQKREKDGKGSGHYFQAFGNSDAHANNKDILRRAAIDGLVHSTTRRFDVQSFAFATHSLLGCAHCSGQVHCVESVAFAYRAHAHCEHCNHPRCLECVGAIASGAPLDGWRDDGRCNYCAGR